MHQPRALGVGAGVGIRPGILLRREGFTVKRGLQCGADGVASGLQGQCHAG